MESNPLAEEDGNSGANKSQEPKVQPREPRAYVPKDAKINTDVKAMEPPETHYKRWIFRAPE